ncbi:MAG: FKBP-type peptidyl-prolyl cis-trans isomerase [Prevotellaceae bacterium]|jgi:FKBP-type peptidyl-prolyl cis-trans isomerase FklB|nr:FKBP-type peptidyl-prolyl cis-trans isomerase [Prevotellaceae bacterium]
MRTTLTVFLSFLLSLSAFLLTGCEETKEVDVYHDWQARNEAFMDSLANVFDARSDASLGRIEDERNKGYYIYYKRIATGDEKQPSPYYNSTITAFYRGMLINEAVFAACPAPKHLTTQYKNLTVFDSNFTGNDPTDFDSPSSFTVNGVISGWTEVLQWMHPGDRWEIYIPYISAYGSTSTTAIPAYSSLVFDITLVAVTQLEVK